jgi:cysteine-S-conjugate beta-lyase
VRLPLGKPDIERGSKAPFNCTPIRTATRWEPGGPTVRFHIGLEAVEDLLADLERGFAALGAAS